jgi:hypothetical protein
MSKTIMLSEEAFAVAEKRAKEQGFGSVAEYLSDLLERRELSAKLEENGHTPGD